VDGREAKILDANMFFSAIAVAPGGHEVKFVYDPLSLKIGAGISIISALCCVLCFLKWGGQRESNP
ncbi:MAG: hypothetical protein PHG97_03330, partial [Candidatus Margulisbacteria bacterium]|nr:hypothetical protein [Candidatus Margulisiibacteriota bacterium]